VNEARSQSDDPAVFDEMYELSFVIVQFSQ